MPPVFVESTVTASERPRAYALARAATNIVIIRIFLIMSVIASTGRFFSE
jgi:hypothetical protein